MITVLLGTGCPSLIPGASIEERTAEANRVISADPLFKKVDEVCSRILPNSEHTFVGKARLFNSVGIIHIYRIGGNLREAETQMTESLKDDGWSIYEVDSYARIYVFRRNDTQIELQFDPIDAEANFGVTCSMVRATARNIEK